MAPIKWNNRLDELGILKTKLNRLSKYDNGTRSLHLAFFSKNSNSFNLPRTVCIKFSSIFHFFYILCKETKRREEILIYLPTKQMLPIHFSNSPILKIRLEPITDSCCFENSIQPKTADQTSHFTRTHSEPLTQSQHIRGCEHIPYIARRVYWPRRL